MRTATIVLSFCFAILFVAGALYFPDAPIRRCGDGFCGKYGAVHPPEMFERYLWWSRIVITLFLLTFAAIASWTGNSRKKSAAEPR